MTSPRRVPSVLSIAGSDSGGGAGIQADLKAFARCGVHGTTAITAITAQNTRGVVAIHALPVDVIVAQIRAVAADLDVAAVKVGMVGSAEAIAAIAAYLDELAPGTPVVVDPVMASTSGTQLLEDAGRAALAQQLVPRATVATPNIPEARALAAIDRDHGDLDGADAEQLARAVHALGARAVVITGGHAERPDDVFFDGVELVSIHGERQPVGADHGSGCTHSAVLAAQLALGAAPLDAARTAQAIVSVAVRDGLRDAGSGPGPVDVFGRARGAS